MKEYYTWKQFDKDCKKIANWANDLKLFTKVFGIPRGGLIIAVRLSHFLNIPLELNSEAINETTLIVDDITDTGTTLQKFENKICATLYWHNQAQKPAFYCREKKKWVVFPWETKESSKYDNTF